MVPEGIINFFELINICNNDRNWKLPAIFKPLQFRIKKETVKEIGKRVVIAKIGKTFLSFLILYDHR